MGFKWDLMGFKWDLMGFKAAYEYLIGFN